MTNNKPPKRDVRIVDLAGELDLNEDSIKRHIRRGAPHSKRNNRLYFNVPEYRAWMAENGLTGERGRPDTPDSPDLEAARLRKENALASKYELQVRRERGELVPLEDVRKHMGELLMVFRNNWVGFGAATVPQLQGRDPAEQQTILDTRAEDLFRNLAKGLTDHFGDVEVA